MNIKEAIVVLAKEYHIPLISGLFSMNKHKLMYMLVYILNFDLRLKYDVIKQYIIIITADFFHQIYISLYFIFSKLGFIPKAAMSSFEKENHFLPRSFNKFH